MPIADAQPLRKAGADKISAYFESAKTDDSIQKAWLVGYKGGQIIWKKPLPLVQSLNLAKTDVVCRKGQIVVLSQFPGCAAYTRQTFSWDGEAAKLVSHSRGDPSQKILDDLTKLATSGTRSQLDDFCKQDHALMYPSNYVTTKTIETIFSGGHKVALALNQAHKPAMAARRMEICFDASDYLISLVIGDSTKTAAPEKWIEQWTSEAMALPASMWAPLLNDYAFFLQDAGKHQQAVNVLHYVIKAQPDRAVAYLNLADSLWTTDRPTAVRMYQRYKVLIADQSPSTKIPDRVTIRIQPTLTEKAADRH
jgi:hypothetical protein